MAMVEPMVGLASRTDCDGEGQALCYWCCGELAMAELKAGLASRVVG